MGKSEKPVHRRPPTKHSTPKTSAPPPREEPPGLAARQIAVDVLLGVLDKGQALDRALERVEGRLSRLEARDRGFASTIVRAVLRRERFLTAVLARLLERPLPAEAQRVRMILLAGAAQLLMLQTPPHAAVSLAVDQCRSDRVAGRFAKLTNAVLRRVPETGQAVLADWDAPRSDIPDWLFGRWSATYGEADARRIATASLERAALDVTVRSGEDIDAWAERLGAVRLSTGSLRLTDAGAVPDLPGFASEAWWVQDAAAALPARLIGDVAGKRIADLCAAPGGKTVQLAAAGGTVTAVDRSAARLERLTQNLARLGLADRVTVVASEIAEFAPAELFDAVLLDAPCSATGTIRRHPDILHLKSAGDLARLATLQSSLLRHASTLVKPGGQLVYCTCSLEPEEGSSQIESFLADTPQFARVPIDPVEIGGASDWITAAGELRTLPFHAAGAMPEAAGIDGFFAARLVRHT